MPTLTIGLSGSAVVNGSKNWTLSDADVQTLIDFMGIKFSPDGETPLAPGQALQAWAQSFVNTTIGEIRRRQKQQQAAAIVVPPLNII